jgi:hypothetical protein
MAKHRNTPVRPSSGTIVLGEKKRATAKLTLKGPTTEPEGRGLAEDLNAVLITYNTRWFLKSDGTKITPRIDSTTGPVE